MAVLARCLSGRFSACTLTVICLRGQSFFLSITLTAPPQAYRVASIFDIIVLNTSEGRVATRLHLIAFTFASPQRQISKLSDEIFLTVFLLSAKFQPERCWWHFLT